MLTDDLRQAVRALRARPIFSLAVVLTMALAIGANTAVFSLVDAVLLSPLPFRDPSRLVAINGLRVDSTQDPFSLPDFRDISEETRAFDSLAAMFQWSANLTGGTAERLQGMRTTANLFPMLGVEAALGRTLTPDDEKGAGHRVVLLTHGLWVRRFGGDPNVIGTSILLNGDSHEVVGVLPRAFVAPVREVDLIAPFPMDADPRRNGRASSFLRLIGRLAPGVTPAVAQADLDAIVARLREKYPETNSTHLGTRVTDWHGALVAPARPLLVLLQVAVGLVLVVACANVANLFLASALRRESEFAVRKALGASRARLARQLLLESSLMALAGGLTGVALERVIRNALDALAPTVLAPLVAGRGVGWSVMMFAAAATATAALAFGLVPALQASFATGAGALQGSRTGRSPRGRRARQTLIAIEVALALALAIATVLLSQSFLRLQSVNLGVREDHLLTMRLSLPRARYAHRADLVRFVEALGPRLLGIPGVLDAAAVNVVPLNGYIATADVWPADRADPPKGQRPEAQYRMITTSYFHSFGVPLLAGRSFDAQDTSGSEAVVVVSETLAHRFWQDRSPLGDSLLVTDSELGTRHARIVGVAGAVRHFGPDTKATLDVYVPISQVPEPTTVWLANIMYWGLLTSTDPGALKEPARLAVQQVDPDVPASAIRSMDEALDIALAPRRLNLTLVTVFASAGLLLAACGIYAVTTFSVTLRTREMGIRTALGADPSHNVAVLVRDAALPIAGGLAAGVALGAAGAPMLRSVLFQVDPLAPIPVLGVTAALLAVGIGAAVIAAWRVRSVDPLVALRAE
jgi:putative ABC transport system permease protein